MNYSEALSYIGSIERTGADFGIERMRFLLDILGYPDKKLKIIHVAGTNGKGSVCAYLTSILRCAGYKVGTYNSPSVFKYNERWCINGKPIDDELLAEGMTYIKRTIDWNNRMRGISSSDEKFDGEPSLGWNGQLRKKEEWLSGKLSPTAFEIETALALAVFRHAMCDIVVFETGLGGRWDATNAILKKELAVITPIGLDHTAILGSTYAEIAAEKAAIIMDDVVTIKQREDVMNEIAHPYRLIGDEKVYIKPTLHIASEPKLLSNLLLGQIFQYDGKIYKIKMLGSHQIQNAAIAIESAKVLREKGWDISYEDIEQGLLSTVWQARFEVVENAKERFNLSVPSGKTFVFDGAHNPHGAAALAGALKEYFENERIHLVIGMLADKEVDGVLNLLLPLASEVTAVAPSSQRAMSSVELKSKMDGILKDMNKEIPCGEENDIPFALQKALDGKCDIVVLCGSLSLFASLNRR